MRKSSAIDGDRDKMIHSVISHVVYVTADDEVSLPNNLVHLPTQNDVILDIDAEEELNSKVNGGDLYEHGENVRDFDDTMREFVLERSRILLGDNGIYEVDEGQMNYMLLHVGGTMDPDKVNSPKSPYDWVYPDPNTAKGESTFYKLDNPGGQSSFSYGPVFAYRAQVGQHTACCLPDGCHPYPPNEYNTAIITHGGSQGEGEHF